MTPPLTLRRHPRAKRIRLRVRPDATLEVTAPPGVPERVVRAFVESQRDWIERARARVEAERLPVAERGPFPTQLVLRAESARWPVDYREAERDRWQWTDSGLAVDLSRREPERARAVLVEALKQRARLTLEPRLTALAERHGLEPERVGWRNQKSRWGSCSSRGRLSLNVRLLFLRPGLVEYVLIHELAHLRHPNHSPAFWDFVGAMLPCYRAARSELRQAPLGVPEWLH